MIFMHLVSAPPVGGLSRSGCGLRKSLGSLLMTHPHPVSCLARGIPALAPASFWVQAGLGTNELEGAYHNGALPAPAYAR